VADTNTPNFNFIKPEISGSVDTWGNKTNGNWDIVDSQLKAISTAALPKAGGTLTGQVKQPNNPVAADDLARKGYVDATISGSTGAIATQIAAAIAAAIPKGTIIMWSGTVATIPSGWGLCDGTIQNGVNKPNLVNKFILGAGATPAPGATGGASTHTHTIGGTALTEAQLPAHKHNVTDPGHKHTLTDPGHVHSVTTTGVSGENGPMTPTGGPNPATVDGSRSVTGISMANAVTGITTQNTGSGDTHTHSCNTGNNMPPYYALCYIIRVV
jgi:hypothetical protein